MKSIFILSTFILLSGAIVSCGDDSKETEETSSEQSKNKEIDLVGTWIPVESSENDEPMEPMNEGVTISFNNDMSWAMAYDGTEFAGGEYETQAGQVFCYVENKAEDGPQQYVWKYYGEGENLILDGYYFKGNDQVNLKIVAKPQ